MLLSLVSHFVHLDIILYIALRAAITRDYEAPHSD